MTHNRWPLLLPLLAACSAGPPPVVAPAPEAAAPSPALHWFRDAAEYRAVAIQTYRAATTAVEAAARGRQPGSWAVILDADETMLDNSEYQRRLELANDRFSDTTWSVWVREEAATAVPGAVAFVRRVRELGGRVAIVTNRAEKICPPTRLNLARLGIEADVVLCQRDESDKNPRFERVRNGTATEGLPPLAVLAWVGDNIHDFPGLSQEIRDDPAAFADFGRRFFALPNPLYGSWQRNRPR